MKEYKITKIHISLGAIHIKLGMYRVLFRELFREPKYEKWNTLYMYENFTATSTL